MWYKLPHIVQSHTNSHTWYRLSGVVQTLTTGTNCDVQYRLAEPTEVWAEGMFCHLESLTCFLPSRHITTTTTLVTLHMSPWAPTLPPVPSHKLSPVGFAYSTIFPHCVLSVLLFLILPVFLRSFAVVVSHLLRDSLWDHSLLPRLLPSLTRLLLLQLLLLVCWNIARSKVNQGSLCG